MSAVKCSLNQILYPKKANMENNNNFNERDPKYWRGGVFYFNADDRRIFVLKKNPAFGVTFNFARPQTYLFIAAVLIYLAAMFYLAGGYSRG